MWPLNALTDWATWPWLQLALRANFVQLLQFHLSAQCSRSISAFAFVSLYICLKRSLANIYKGLRVDREGWCFEHSVSWLRVCLSAEGTKNVSWPWLSPLRGWGSLTMAFTGKFVYIIYIWGIQYKNINFSVKYFDVCLFSIIYIYIYLQYVEMLKSVAFIYFASLIMKWIIMR